MYTDGTFLKLKALTTKYNGQDSERFICTLLIICPQKIKKNYNSSYPEFENTIKTQLSDLNEQQTLYMYMYMYIHSR